MSGSTGTRCWVLRVLDRAGGSGDGPGAVLADEPQVEQSAQVEGSHAVLQPVVVVGHAAVADPSVAVGEPGDAAFDHRAVSPVGLLELDGLGLSSGCAKQVVTLVHGEPAPFL